MLLEPRKRPHQQRSAATVDAILEAAAHILERKGLDALTTNSVAELAGISIGSFYQYLFTRFSLMIHSPGVNCHCSYGCNREC